MEKEGDREGMRGYSRHRGTHMSGWVRLDPGSMGPTHLIGRRAGLLVVLGLDADPHHARLIHHLLDQLAVLADHLPCGPEGEASQAKTTVRY